MADDSTTYRGGVNRAPEVHFSSSTQQREYIRLNARNRKQRDQSIRRARKRSKSRS
jgi:hypothetical protein